MKSPASFTAISLITKFSKSKRQTLIIIDLDIKKSLYQVFDIKLVIFYQMFAITQQLGNAGDKTPVVQVLNIVFEKPSPHHGRSLAEIKCMGSRNY